MRNRNRAASKKDYDITNLDTEIDSQAVRLAGEDRAMKLADGIYTTDNNSEMVITKQGGVSRVMFDWFEEPNACVDCKPEAYEQDGCLVWHCDVCSGGKAILHKIGDVKP